MNRTCSECGVDIDPTGPHDLCKRCRKAAALDKLERMLGGARGTLCLHRTSYGAWIGGYTIDGATMVDAIEAAEDAPDAQD